MDDLDKYIDGLFQQKLTGAEIPASTSGSEWMQLSKSIRRRNFMRFNPGSFNVYYLAASVGVVATAGAIVLPGVVGTKPNGKVPIEKNIILKDTTSTKDTLPIEKDSTYRLRPTEIKEAKKSQITPIAIKSDDQETVAVAKSVEGAQKEEDKSAIIKSDNDSTSIVVEGKEENSLLNKEPVPQAIQDTIVHIDTVHIQKKGVLFRRKRH